MPPWTCAHCQSKDTTIHDQICQGYQREGGLLLGTVGTASRSRGGQKVLQQVVMSWRLQIHGLV